MKVYSNSSDSFSFSCVNKKEKSRIQGNIFYYGTEKCVFFATFSIGEDDDEEIRVSFPNGYEIKSVRYDYRKGKINHWKKIDPKSDGRYVSWYDSPAAEIFIADPFHCYRGDKIPSGGGDGTIFVDMQINYISTFMSNSDSVNIVCGKEYEISLKNKD